MRKIRDERLSRFLVTASCLAIMASALLVMYVTMPEEGLSSQNPGIELADAAEGYDGEALAVDTVLPVSVPDTAVFKPGTVVVSDADTTLLHVYEPTTPRSHCSFGYEVRIHGCVTRGKFPVVASGVWGVACRLGNCRKFGELCLFVPRRDGWGDKMILPAKIKYRQLPQGAKAGAC